MLKRPGPVILGDAKLPKIEFYHMKKPPRRKPSKAMAKPNLQQLTVATSHTMPKPQSKASRLSPPDRPRSKINLATIRRRFWPTIGALATAANIASYFWPSLTLATGANLDPRQDFQTSFVATNTGHVPIYGITFLCQLVGDRMKLGNQDTDGALVFGGDAINVVPVLKKGEPATRSCFKKSLSINGPMLKVTAYYHWPLIGSIASTTAYFAPRRGEAGTVLVQEPEPSEPLPVLISSGAIPGS